MISNINYFEEEAKLIISTTSGSKRTKYSYRDIPLILYNQIFQLHKRSLEGKIWKLLKNCDFEKIENINKEEER